MKHLLIFLSFFSLAQAQESNEKASLNAGLDATGARFTIEATGLRPEAPLFYKTEVTSTAVIKKDLINENANLIFTIIQGKTKRLSVELIGQATVKNVIGERVASWAVREEKTGDTTRRFLDLVPTTEEGFAQIHATVLLESKTPKGKISLSTFGPANPAGFSAEYEVKSEDGMSYRLVEANGMMKMKNGHLKATDRTEIAIETYLAATESRPVEWTQTSLEGKIDAKNKVGHFKWVGVATVSAGKAEPEAVDNISPENTAEIETSDLKKPIKIDFLSGNAAPLQRIAGDGYRLVLENGIYRFLFTKPGVYPLEINFVAKIEEAKDWRALNFSVPGGAVLPVTLTGLSENAVFAEESAINLISDSKNVKTQGLTPWAGFLPADGRVVLRWNPDGKAEEGKLFFTTTAMSEVSVGAGLLRQATTLAVKTLQGELASLDVALAGEGEILSVDGARAWSVESAGKDRVLKIQFEAAVAQGISLVIKSQTALAALPAKSEPLRLTPLGAVRHSGFLRVANQGAVKLEVTKSLGLTQLSPDQSPQNREANGGERQVFYYRFPSEKRSYEIAVDRVRPETSVSQVLVYELTDTDRVLRADIELDIREAGIREYELRIPADYPVVACTGPEVSDYVLSEPEKGERRLKILFTDEVAGRRLISFHLEKNENAAAGNWTLPVPHFSDVKSLRGQVGIAAVPGFRLSVGKMDGLAEIPLAHFQVKAENLQQTYRIRGESWQAQVAIEALGQNVQADLYHLYALKEKVAYASILVNYFVTGAPVDEWKLRLPEGARNVQVEGREVRDSRQEKGVLLVPLHRSVMGAYQLLVTYEQDAGKDLALGSLQPMDVQGERGFVQVVSPEQVALKELQSAQAVKLDPLELPAEYRLMSHAPSLAAWQYTGRPFELNSQISWHDPVAMAKQVVEFCELQSQVARDGSVATKAIFAVRSQGEQMLRLDVPAGLKIWEVKVDGAQVTTREIEGSAGRLVPLPGAWDENLPVRVEVRVGQEATGELVTLKAPTVAGRTQLTTRWSVKADEGRVLKVADAALLSPLTAAGESSGFDWVAHHALWELTAVTLLIFAGFLALRSRRFGLNLTGVFALFLALGFLFSLSLQGFGNEANLPQELDFVLPVLAPGVPLHLSVTQGEVDKMGGSGLGALLIILGLAGLIWAKMGEKFTRWAAFLGLLFLAIGLLLQVSGAGWFFVLVAILVIWLAWPRANSRFKKWRSSRDEATAGNASASAMVTVILAALILIFASQNARADKKMAPPMPQLPERASADELTETWSINEEKSELSAAGKMIFTATEVGQEFLLLRAPAVLSKADGVGIKVVKKEEAGGWSYVMVPSSAGRQEVSFSYGLKLVQNGRAAGIPLLSGQAAARELRIKSSEKNVAFSSSAALWIEEKAESQAIVHLGPAQDARVFLSDKKTEIAETERRFYVEMANLFVPGPGVVDGRHELQVRPSQGKVAEMELSVPKEFTIGEVRGENVKSWRFDPEKLLLKITLGEAVEKPFSLQIESQRALGELPADLTLSPLRVRGAAGEAGTLGLAFGADAQLDKVEAKGMSAVALTDFAGHLLPMDAQGQPRASLREVFRYGKEEASLALRVVEVMPELRVTTNEVLSLGEERVVLRTDLQAQITRAGIFKMSFELPEGFEVESLSGAALSHWTEVKEGGKTVIVLHLNGKTIGVQEFALSLVGVTPKMGGDGKVDTNEKSNEPSLPHRRDAHAPFGWAVPRVIVREAARQSGQIVVVPGQGIQLKELARKDASALDPRELGGNEAGSLAYRLLQKSWSLKLELSQQEAWVTAKFLQDVELREEQVKSRVDALVTIERASLNSLRVRLPDLSENDAHTVRASGLEVRDMLPVAGEKGLWEIIFKRRVVGEIALRIEYEESGRADAEKVSLRAIELPVARQVEGYLALRPGLRLELQLTKSAGWQESDWVVLPKELRQVDRSESPALCLRSKGEAGAVVLSLKRHEVAESLRLRVREGQLHSILSAGGEMMNEAVITLQVMQAGSLSLRLPPQSELLGVFVNEESTRVVRDGDAYIFQISGDAGRDEAQVRFFYVTEMAVADLKKVSLEAFRLGLPLENVTWKVSLPHGYELDDAEGDLDLQEERTKSSLDLAEYQSEVREQNATRASEARERLDKVSGFLRDGEQQKALSTLGQVSNAFALDAASNEDARIQRDALQRRQVVIGLNTRNQRLVYDNQLEIANGGANEQVLQAAGNNPVFRGDVNFKQGDYGRLLEGNTQEENRMLNVIASSWVAHQQGSEPIPRLLKLVLADSGENYIFHRGIQVDGDQALRLELKVDKTAAAESGEKTGVYLLVILLMLGLGCGVVFRKSGRSL